MWRRTPWLFHHPYFYHIHIYILPLIIFCPFKLISSKHISPIFRWVLIIRICFIFVSLSFWSHKHFQIRLNQVLVSIWVNLIVLGSLSFSKPFWVIVVLLRVFTFSFCVFKSIQNRLAPLVNPRLERSLLTSLLQLSQIGFSLCAYNFTYQILAPLPGIGKVANPLSWVLFKLFSLVSVLF